MRSQLCLIFGPLTAAMILFTQSLSEIAWSATACACAAVACWMAVWWISDAVPLAATALLPVALFPLLGVANGKAIAAAYFNHIIFLFLGGFLIAIAMQKWNLHRRIALAVLLFFGSSLKGLLLGFMSATAFLSMWISNTATAMLMTPVALAVIVNLENIHGKNTVRPLAIGILIGIAYSASLGGIATLIGTPPNLSFARILTIMFAEVAEISFAEWMWFALPLSACMLASAYGLVHTLFLKQVTFTLNRNYFQNQYRELGKASMEEKMVFTVFVTLAFLWIFRTPIEIGIIQVPGWSQLLAQPEYVNDGVVAIAMGLLLFVLPTSQKNKKILDASAFQALPWHIVLLFGGGFALATGFVDSGLSTHLASWFSTYEAMPTWVLVMIIAVAITFITELTSNTATTEIFLPVLGALATGLKLHPLLLMLPATLAASCAFMLPVATPPNAIVFGTNRIRIAELARTGITLNLLGSILIVLAVLYWAPIALGFNPSEFAE